MGNQTPQTLDATDISVDEAMDFQSIEFVEQPVNRLVSVQDVFDDIFSTLDPFQQIATMASGHVLCAARPGSGKTRVLVARILRGMLDHGPTRVTAITFTRASASEMRTRLFRLVGRSAEKVSTSTFHAFALDAIRRHSRVKIIDDRDRFLVLIRLLQDAHIHYPADRLIGHIPDYFNHDQSALGILPEGVITVLQNYEIYLQSNRMIDLDSVVPTMADLVQSGSVVVKADLLLVDEFQDIDPAQARLIAAIADQGAHVFCVGDDDQSIYGFRRSLGPQAFHLLKKRLNAEILFLSTNYRCARAIAQTAEQPLLNLSDRIDKPLIIHRDGGLVRGIRYQTQEQEMMTAATYCSDQASRGRSSVILARTNNILDAMEGLLRVAEIPYSRSDSKSFWDGQHVRKCLAFMGLPFKPSTHDLYVALHATPIPYDTVKGVMSHFQQNLPSHFSREDLLDNLYDRSITSSMETEHAEHFRNWRIMLSDWSESCESDDQWTASTRVFESIIANSRKQGMISTATILERFFSTPNKQGDMVPIKTRLQWLASPNELNDTNDAKSIRLMTIHGAKGLEFDLVWILSAKNGVIPHEDAESEDEERRIFYVGMTRAIDELVISNASSAADRPLLPFSFNWQPPEENTPFPTGT